MENISIKLPTRYKSLQEGFEWKDIPPFAVVTGVNGVGKTQLLEAIRGRGDRANNRGLSIFREISSPSGPVNLIFSENTTQSGLSLNGLIEYVKNSDQRLVELRNLDQQIKSSQNFIIRWREQVSRTSERVERLQLEKSIRIQEEQIRNCQNQKLNVNIFAYD